MNYFYLKYIYDFYNRIKHLCETNETKNNPCFITDNYSKVEFIILLVQKSK
jgi:hypothetical protein